MTKISILERFSTIKTEVKEQTEFLVNISQGLCKYCENCHFVTASAKHQAPASRDPLTTMLLRGVERCRIDGLLERSKQVYFIPKQQGSCPRKEPVSPFPHLLALQKFMPLDPIPPPPTPDQTFCFQPSQPDSTCSQPAQMPP